MLSNGSRGPRYRSIGKGRKKCHLGISKGFSKRLEQIQRKKIERSYFRYLKGDHLLWKVFERVAFRQPEVPGDLNE